MVGLRELPAEASHPLWQEYRRGAAETFTRENLGVVLYVVRVMGSPGEFFDRLPWLFARGNRLTRVELLHRSRGLAVLRCVPDESFYSPIGMVHGGLLCTLLDTVAGLAVHSMLPAGTGYSTIEIKVNFLRPLRGGGGELEARGRVVKLGRSVAFAECEARAEDGELVGSASTSLLIARVS